MRKNCNDIETDLTTKQSTVEKQIISINDKIDQQEKRADSVAKKDNNEYIKLWDLQLNDIIHNINSVKFIFSLQTWF